MIAFLLYRFFMHWIFAKGSELSGNGWAHKQVDSKAITIYKLTMIN